ncbi:MAG: TolC family protein [Muribaculaceae bacterium]|nr:TolC family protein [Muribaculaceae bacterium]
MKKSIFIVFLAAILLSSCSGVKNLSKPQLDLPTRLAGNATDTATLADVEWWKLYADSALVYIIRQTLDHNRDLGAAAARVEQMRELYGVTKANFFPTLTGLAGANHETNDYYGSPHSDDPEVDLKFTLSWEADLWGGLSWAKKKGAANYLEAVENARAMRITLIAEAASAYYRLLALDNELAIVRRTLFTREENLKKAKLRFEGGLTPETVYQQAQVEYATTAALIPGLERQVEVQKNAIALLMGRYPAEEIERSTLSLEEPLPESFPVGLPTTLLQRRPDLRAAEAALRSALAGVGVSYADQFPKLRIGLTGGWENDDFVHFFRSPFTYVIGNITGTILDFGRNRRRYKASIQQYEQARLAYEQKVLTAFHEVDNAALTFRLIRQTTERRRELLEAARKYARLAYAQYNMGVINYIDVLDAQRRYFDAQVGLSNAVRDQYLALVNLYKCLGGGFQ